MDYRNIPGTDLTVSLLGFGNFTFGETWWTDASDEEAVGIQNYAVDKGVTFFDTAPAYGKMRAEKLIKPTVQYAGRDNLVISTKFGYDMQDPTYVSNPNAKHKERGQDFSEAYLRGELERSLENMGVECIDLYQAHNIKYGHYCDELFEVLEKFKAEGKIRYWGVALGPAIGWRAEGHDAFNKFGADTVQTVWNMYEQDLGKELVEICQHRGTGGVIARVPTNSGILDDEFHDDQYQFPPHDHRKYRDRAWLTYGIKKNNIIRPMAEELGLNLSQFSTRWLASQPGLVSLEPNIIDKEQIDTYSVGCNGESLPEAMLEKIASLYADDFGLGDAAHPCDFKDTFADGGSIRSGYQAPALV